MSPAELVLDTSVSAPGIASFTASGVDAQGNIIDLTNRVQWESQDLSLLTATNLGQFQAGTAHGGRTLVTARLDGWNASAKVTVKLHTTRVASSAPSSAASLFANAPPDTATALSVVYPIDDAYVPRNLSTLEVHWRSSNPAASVEEISVKGATIDYRLYVVGATNASGKTFAFDAQDWATLVDSAAGWPVYIQVRARSAANGAVSISTPVSLTIAKEAVNGGIYYWTVSAGNNSAIMRHDFGAAAASAQLFFSNTNMAPLTGSNRCVGCHSLSADGSRLFMSYGDTNPDWGVVVDVATKQATPAQTGGTWIFSSFSPDNQRIIASYHGESLRVIDLAAGNATVAQTVPLTAIVSDVGATMAAHPNWSADGSRIVFTLGRPHPGNTPSEWVVTHGSVVVMTVDGAGQFGSPQVLVPSEGEVSNYYPSFSPDGKWILFNRAASGHAYANPEAEVYVIAADGSAPARPLRAVSGTTASTDSWPRWTPFVQSNALSDDSVTGGSLYYFTFSSKRDYGNTLVSTGRTQLWMAAFDPAAVSELDEDPSYSPFWLPFQESTTDNHAAQWTEVIVPAIN